MKNIFKLIPSPKEMIDKSKDDESLKEYLKNVFKQNEIQAHNAYKLISYIFTTNRATIKLLEKEDRIPNVAEGFK